MKRRLSCVRIARVLVEFRLGFHALPIEQGRFARPALPRHLRRCTVCDTQAVGDEIHCVFDCPHFSEVRAQFPGLFPRAIQEMAVRGSTGKRLVTRSIPDWRSYWYSACYSVLVSQAGCNGRVTSPPFFFFQDATGVQAFIHEAQGAKVCQPLILPHCLAVKGQT